MWIRGSVEDAFFGEVADPIIGLDVPISAHHVLASDEAVPYGGWIGWCRGVDDNLVAFFERRAGLIALMAIRAVARPPRGRATPGGRSALPRENLGNLYC